MDIRDIIKIKPDGTKTIPLKLWDYKITLLKHFQIYIFPDFPEWRRFIHCTKQVPCLYLIIGKVTFCYLYKGRFNTYFAIDSRVKMEKAYKLKMAVQYLLWEDRYYNNK